MTDTLDLDERHSYLRNKLDILGFCQPLPLSAISLVSAILDDLVKTTESLKNAKRDIGNLCQEREIWELGVEPYKCDNSRLLAQCNSLNLELLKQKEKHDLKNLELARTIRYLELDKSYLEEHCQQLNKKIRNLELKYNQGGETKNNKEGVNMSKKPFVSTVRSGDILPKDKIVCNVDSNCIKIACSCVKYKPEADHDVKKCQNDAKNQADMLEVCQRQLDAKDREIQRLNKLLAGGRPPSALAKDCCFKGVGALAEDVEILQNEKTALQNQLQESIQCQHEAMQRAMRLCEENKNLRRELNELEKIALNVESEANKAMEKQIAENDCLKIQLNETKQRLNELNCRMQNARKSPERNNEKMNVRQDLQKANEEKKELIEKINETTLQVQELHKENEKLLKRNSKLKSKLASQRECADQQIEEALHMNLRSNDEEKSDEHLKEVLRPSKIEQEYHKMKSERDYYQKEFIKLSEKRTPSDIERLKHELAEKDCKITLLKSDIELLRNSKSDVVMSNRSVQSTINRLERERDCVKTDLLNTKAERDLLREKLKLATENHICDQRRYEEIIQNSNDKINRLESEKHKLTSSQVPAEAAINLLGCEIEELRTRLRDIESENCQLKIRYNQIKMLQEQTEKSLTDKQNKLLMSENQKTRVESKLSQVDSNRECVQQEVGSLKGELCRYKNMCAELEREKDKLLIELDSKTEKVCRLQNESKHAIADKRELERELDQLKRKFDEKSIETLHSEDTLREVCSESSTLRKQLAALKRSNDNAVSENCRLINEVTDITTELTITKRNLKESEAEVEKLKLKLQNYVVEIRRVEELLLLKESEREEMLEHYRSLSHDAIVLEGNNHSLEMEASETKKQLDEAEAKLADLEALLIMRDNEIKCFEEQVSNLSCQISKLEIEIENVTDENRCLRSDLEAVKDLCDKLDLQKDKLNEELNEHSTIRQQLERDNERLKCDIQIQSTGDRAAADGMKELLQSSRQELDQYIRCSNSLNQEIIKLKNKVEELENKLTDEHTNAMRNEALAHEYCVQLQEMRQIMTNERFEHAQSKEDIDRNENTVFCNEKRNICSSSANKEFQLNLSVPRRQIHKSTDALSLLCLNEPLPSPSAPNTNIAQSTKLSCGSEKKSLCPDDNDLMLVEKSDYSLEEYLKGSPKTYRQNSNKCKTPPLNPSEETTPIMCTNPEDSLCEKSNYSLEHYFKGSRQKSNKPTKENCRKLEFGTEKTNSKMESISANNNVSCSQNSNFSLEKYLKGAKNRNRDDDKSKKLVCNTEETSPALDNLECNIESNELRSQSTTSFESCLSDSVANACDIPSFICNPFPTNNDVTMEFHLVACDGKIKEYTASYFSNK